VHPEAYGVARRILAAAGASPADVPRGPGSLAALDPQAFVDETFGVPTVRDIMAELEKPGRDPRPSFTTASFSEGVEKISDLVPGMVLEGTVTNVAAFGAFVDVGVHQDGLVHISAMSSKFVSDPHEVVKSGQVVKVKVLEADPERKRISLTLRLDDAAGQTAGTGRGAGGDRRPAGGRTAGTRSSGASAGRGQARDNRPARSGDRNQAPANTAMAEALRRAGLGK
jgi:uncharacterized protein